MKKNVSKLFFGILFISVILLSLSFISALTINSPTTGTTIKGTTYLFNLTTALVKATNCNFSTTADGVFLKFKNSSASQTEFATNNASTNTVSLTQTSSTTLTARCSNGTTNESASITIGIDNNNPTCAFSVDNTETKYMSPIGVATTQSSTDATTTLTYAWNLYDPNNAVARSSTSSAPIFSGSDFAYGGSEYKLALTVTDVASNTATCTNQTIFVRADSRDGIYARVAVGEATKSTTTPRNTILFVMGGLVFILFIVISGAYLIGAFKKR